MKFIIFLKIFNHNIIHKFRGVRLWEVVKLKIRNHAYLRIFSLTTSRNKKIISKANLK